MKYQSHFVKTSLNSLLFNAIPRRTASVFAVFVVSIFLCACGGGGNIEVEIQPAPPAPYPIAMRIEDLHFPDPELEKCVRDTKALHTAELTVMLCENISDTSGIDQLPFLKVLTFKEGSFESIDLSNNAFLEEFAITNVPLSHIDVSSSPKLRLIYLTGTEINSLDTSNNLELEILTLQLNPSLKKIDISENTKLTHIYLYGDYLEALDTSSNLALESILSESSFGLTSLDLRANENLEYFHMKDGVLETIALPIAKLGSLNLRGNKFTALDLSLNINLYSVVVNNNQLSALLLPPDRIIPELRIAGNPALCPQSEAFRLVAGDFESDCPD